MSFLRAGGEGASQAIGLLGLCTSGMQLAVPLSAYRALADPSTRTKAQLLGRFCDGRQGFLPPGLDLLCALLVDNTVPVHPTFEALLQGDAGGLLELRVIDDFFSLGIEQGSFVEGMPSLSSAVASAKDCYKAVEKDQIYKPEASTTVAEHLTLSGFSVHKRLAWAAASLRAAQCPVVS